MKEIAILGTTGPVFGQTLTAFLENNYSVEALVTNPEKLMLDTTNVNIDRLDLSSELATEQQLAGYSVAVLAIENDLQNHDLNDLILRSFSPTVNAAIKAGVKRLVIIGGKDSEAFYLQELNRHDGLNYRFITTEGDYAAAAVAASKC